jgi:hypothetical protein
MAITTPLTQDGGLAHKDADLNTLFRKDACGLYSLALLLTTDRSAAKRCSVPVLNSTCVRGNTAERERNQRKGKDLIRVEAREKTHAGGKS